MLTVKAPAKLNLTLEVLGKRPNGYHEVRSVLQTVDLCDTLSFQPYHGIHFEADLPSWSAGKSLVGKAVSLLQRTFAVSSGVDIKMGKRIPQLAGLGGDSSGAAAVLRGLNELWELDLSMEKLLALAVQLGSDVPFFLYGGTALAEGRGEKVTPLPPLPRMWVVLFVPDVPREPGKTGRMYAAIRPAHYTDGRVTEDLMKALKEGGFRPTMLFNTFENIAFALTSRLNVYKEHFIKLGAPDVHLAGSGPALFALLEDESQAKGLYTRCKNQGMEAYLVGTV